MPGNPQDTLGLPALKYYGRMRSIRTETLAWINLVNEKGARVRASTIPLYHEKELLDYILVDVMTPTIGSYPFLLISVAFKLHHHIPPLIHIQTPPQTILSE